MARRRRNLRGTKITGNWWDKQPDGREGKRCEITGAGGKRGFPGTSTYIFDVQECARVCGSHFFEAASMRFFKSRVGDTAYHDGRGGAYFTTGETPPSGGRAYTVRHYDPESCRIKTVGEFNKYKTAAQAKAAAKHAAIENASMVPDHAAIEEIALDAEKIARAAKRKGDKETARHMQARADEIRRQKFALEGSRRRR